MLIDNRPSEITYEFTGVRTFSIGFPFYGLESISVLYRASADTLTPFTPLVAGVDFTVTGVRAGTSDSDIAFKSGSVTLTDAGVERLQNGYQVLITRETPIVQQYAYNELDNFPAKSHENALGRLTTIAQELHNKARNAVTIPPGSGESGEDVLADILDAANRAEGAAGDAATSAQEAKDVAATVNPDNFVAIDNTQWGMDAVGMDFYGESDKGRVPVVDQNGERLVFKDPVSLLAGEEKPSFRNIILAGKNKDGQPAFLIGQDWLRTPHRAGTLLGPLGAAKSSSQYDSNYTAERPFANQVVYSGSYWHTPANTPTGWVEYEYAEAFVPTGLNFLLRGQSTCWPSSYVVEGYDDATQVWEILYSDDGFRQQTGDIGSVVGSEFGTTIWFTQNTKEYKRLRFRVLASIGQYVQVQTLRYFTCEHTNLSPFDIVVDASPQHPLKVSIAKGQYGDKAAVISRPIIIPGKLFYEMARNYLYAVPQNGDGSAPDYIDVEHAIHVPDAGIWLWVSTKKIDYSSSLDELRSKTVLVFQSNDTEAYTASSKIIRASSGYWKHELVANAVTSDIAKGYRGSSSSWLFGASTSSYIYVHPTMHTQVLQPTADTQPGMQSFTLELDFNYTGPDENTSGYYVLFDGGQPTGYNGAWAVAYNHQVGRIQVIASQAQTWTHSIPFVAAPGEWYTLSISVSNQKIYFHINGKCIGAYAAFPVLRSGTYNYMIGRWQSYTDKPFKGYINNVRYVLGQCLRQSENYQVSPIFKEDTLPDGVLWWNYGYGCVQQYKQSSQQWVDTPMLAIGHIDTGDKEHLHTWQPRGTNRDYNIQKVKSFTTNGSYSSSHPAQAASNFGNGGAYPYLTPSGASNNTNAYWVQLELFEPTALDELRLHGSNEAWNTFPAIFTWQGSNDAQNWTTLIDRSNFVRDGNPNLIAKHWLGDVHNGNAIKRFPYYNTTAYRFYKFTLLPKGAVPLYAGTYSMFRAQFMLAGGTPEVQCVQPYVIGDVYAAPVFMMTVGKDYIVPIPFGGLPYDVRQGSYVVEINDFERKRRPLGQNEGYWANDMHYEHGEVLYQTEQALVITTGNIYLSPYNGNTHNTRAVAASSSYGNAVVIARRIY